MVWGRFSSMGVGKPVFVEKNIDSLEYVNVLKENLEESTNMMNLPVYTFQQDNASPHKSKFTRNWFQRNGIDVMSWPAQSPDLNPIENIWEKKQKVNKRSPKLIPELKGATIEEWYNFPRDSLKKPAESFYKRASLCFEAKCGHIDYQLNF